MACALRAPELFPQAGVTTKHFQDSILSRIWSYCEEAYSEGDGDHGPDRYRTAVGQKATAQGLPEIDELYLLDIESLVPTGENIRYYGGIVRDEWLSRQIVQVAKGASQPKEKGPRHLSHTLSLLLDLQSESNGHSKTARLGELLRTVVSEAKTQKCPGIPTGFVELDQQIHGIQRGVITDVGAWTSWGKSTLAICMALHAARSGYSIDIYSLEDVATSVCRRLLAMLSGVRTSVLMTGHLTSNEWNQVESGRDILQSLKINIYDQTFTSATDFMIQAKRNAIVNKTDLIVVDYVQLLSEPGNSNRNDEMTAISRRIKRLAKETNCGIIRCSQLRRPDTGLKNQIPSVHHLRDSGSLEQDSHVILLINKSHEENVREVIIGKNKDGPTGSIKLRWDAHIPAFRSMAT